MPDVHSLHSQSYYSAMRGFDLLVHFMLACFS